MTNPLDLFEITSYDDEFNPEYRQAAEGSAGPFFVAGLDAEGLVQFSPFEMPDPQGNDDQILAVDGNGEVKFSPYAIPTEAAKLGKTRARKPPKIKPTHDEFGLPLDPERICPQHFVDWKTHYREHPTEADFVKYICNNAVVLNQKKQGNLVHFPCHGVGDGIMREFKSGWRQVDYLLVLPAPSTTDAAGGTLELSVFDRVSLFVRNELEEARIPLERCLVTYACRFALPVGTTSYNAGHKTACALYVQEDARNVKPKVIITFGTDALKALQGAKTKLATFRGNVEDFEGIPIVPTQTPKEFMGGYGGIEIFRGELLRAREIVEGQWVKPVVDKSGYLVVDTVEKMRELVATIQAVNPRRLVFDYEFGSLTKREEHQIQRSCQLCWGPGQAAFVKLKGVGGIPCHTMEDYDTIVRLLGEIMRGPWQLAGHHLRTDINENYRLGIGTDDKLETGFCTMLAYHLLHGDDDIGLDQLCRRYTPQFGAYWSALETWLDTNGRSKQLQFGYLFVPDEILIPYGLCDADVTYRSADFIEAELLKEPGLHTLFTELSMPTALYLMDTERQGILVDEAKRMEIRDIVKPEYEAIMSEFRQMANWPDFDPAKAWQIASYLYGGTEYKNAKPLPEGVTSLGLKPPFNTDKYPMAWEEIEEREECHLHGPSTKSTAIDLLIQQNPDMQQLRYLKFMSVLGKFLNTYLSPQDIDPETNFPTPGKSFSANIWSDGRVRTHLAQTSETGRWRSFGANLQTNPKKQQESLLEAFVYRRFGGMSLQEYKRRTDPKRPAEDMIPKEDRIRLPDFKEVYIPAPGNCFMEVDFQTAEICVWAYCSGDVALTQMILQGRDIHCETATACFQLPIAEELQEGLRELEAGDPKRYKKWVAMVKDVYGSLRTVAKAILFGLIYGRGANALSREINKQGVPTDPQQCQNVINGIAKRFPQGWQWLIERQQEAIKEERVTNAFGFRRYFSGAAKLDNSTQARIKRQGPNSAIQGCVAMLLARSGVSLYRFRYRTELGRKIGFKTVLPIHDAHLIEQPLEYFEVTKKLVRVAMSTSNKIPGTPYSLGVDFPGYPMMTAADH